jgi:hypothetical protein
MTMHPALTLLDRVAALAGTGSAAGVAMRLGLHRDAAAEELAWEGPPALRGAERVRVRATGSGAVDLVELLLAPGSGPTRPELEAALGRADQQPRAAGAGCVALAFPPRGRVTPLAYVDDATARASRLVARRD